MASTTNYDQATPSQIKAIGNCVFYRTGGRPSDTYLTIEGLTFEEWLIRQIEHLTAITVASLEALDRRTASKIIGSLTK